MLIKVDKAKRVRGPFSFTCFPIPAPFAGRDVSDRREGEDDVFVNVSPYIESAPEKPKEAFCRRECAAISSSTDPGELKTMEAGLCFPNAEQPQTP